MMMELFLRLRYWSVLQVVAILVCCRGKVVCDRVQGCVTSQLSLNCSEMKVVQITSIVLGDSECRRTSCCIKDSDCTRNANANHRRDVRRRCDNKQSCVVAVLREKIPCGTWGVWQNNDFERITYNCIDHPQRSTTSMPDSTENIVHTEENLPKNETENGSSDTESSTVLQNTEGFNQNTTDQIENGSPEYQSDNNPWVLPVVMTTVCLLIAIAIIVVVFIMRRKRLLKGNAAVEMTEGDSNLRNEIINENETTSPSNVSGSPINSNDKIKQSKNNDANVSQNYEVPSNCAAGNSGSTSTEDRHIYCNVDSREPVYLVPRPRDDVYSVVKDVGEPECADSNASIIDNSVYSDVETREPAKATNGNAQNAYIEAISWKESGNEAVRVGKTIHQDRMKKETNSPAHKRAPDSYTKVNKPSRNVATVSEPPGKVESKDKDGTSGGYPNPIYEEMSPLIPESTYANAPLLSVASRAIPTGEGSITENPYCEMKSPPVSRGFYPP